MGLAAEIVEDLPFFESIPSEQIYTEQDPEYWEEFHAKIRETVAHRLKAEPDSRDLLMAQVDLLLLRMYLVEVRFAAEFLDAEARAQEAFSLSKIVAPTPDTVAAEQELSRMREYGWRMFRTFQEARGELQKLRQHGFFPQPYLLEIRDGEVTLDPARMELNIPYVFDIDGDTMAAVKVGDLDVEIYDLAMPEVNGDAR